MTVAEVTPDDVAALPSAERTEPLPDDLACVACGYALRGLSPAGDCPECGEPIAASLDARERWGLSGDDARAVASGFRLTGWSLLATAGAIVLIPLSAAAQDAYAVVVALFTATSALEHVLWLRGVRRLTRVNPASPAAKLARLGAWLSAVTVGFAHLQIWALVSDLYALSYEGLLLVAMLALPVLRGITGCALIALLKRLRRVTRSQEAFNATMTSGYVTAVGGVGFVVCGLLAAATSGGGARGLSQALIGLSLICGFVSWLFTLVTGGTAVRLSKKVPVG